MEKNPESIALKKKETILTIKKCIFFILMNQ